MPTELNVLALFKHEERYIFVYDDDSRDRVIREIWGMAGSPACPVNWFDATMLVKRVYQQTEGST